MLMLWYVGYGYDNRNGTIPAWLSLCTVVPITYGTSVNLKQLALHLISLLKRVSYCYPETQFIFMPEAAIMDQKFLCSCDIALFLQQNIPVKALICGMLRSSSEGDCCNSVAYICRESFHVYDKKLLVPIMEETPLPFLIAQECEHVMMRVGVVERPIWSCHPMEKCVPYICSEFFYCEDDGTDTTIIAFCSDRWALLCYLKWLMAEAARFVALTRRRNVLYIAYAYVGFITAMGEWVPVRVWGNFDEA
jgi:hypothetical protein